MLEANAEEEALPQRLCLCCGAPTATRSIPACWDHWSLLPDELRLPMVANYGRCELQAYAENLLQAVRIWRQAGAWPLRSWRKAASPARSRAMTDSELRSAQSIISLLERRPKSAWLTADYSTDEALERLAGSRS